MKSALLILILAVACRVSPAAERNDLTDLAFEQKLGAQVTVGTQLRDEQDRAVTLGDCLGRAPAILILGYYECPMLCNVTLNNVVEGLQEIKPSADSGAQLIFLSIDPRESAALARAKKKTYLKRFGRPGAESSWHFLRGDSNAVKRLAGEAGFSYRYDSARNQFAHPSGIVILGPSGKISRYFLGLTYPAAELQEALREAAGNRTGSLSRKLLILCSQFVPLTGKFSGLVMGAVRSVAVVTLLGVGAYILFSGRRQKPLTKGER